MRPLAVARGPFGQLDRKRFARLAVAALEILEKDSPRDPVAKQMVDDDQQTVAVLKPVEDGPVEGTVGQIKGGLGLARMGLHGTGWVRDLAQVDDVHAKGRTLLHLLTPTY